MEEHLTARLLNTPALTAIVGTRINWGERPQKDQLPAVTMAMVSPGRRYLLSGADLTQSPRVQFDCYAATTAQARAIARILRDTLEIPAAVVWGLERIAFSASLLDSERGPLIEDTGGGLKVHRYSLDFVIWFSPAA